MRFRFHKSTVNGRLQAHVQDRMKRPFVTVVLSLFMALTGAVSASAAAEIPLSLPPSFIAADTTAAASQESPAAAFDGLNFLTAWSESEEGARHVVYINRISRDGQRLDGRGVRITASAGNQLAPRVLFDGTRYLVAWKEPSTSGPALYFRRVARDGTMIDAAPVAITAAPCVFDDFDMATTGDRTVFVWTDCARNVVAARIDNASAMVLDSEAAEVSTGANGHTPRVVYGGGIYFVAWEERIPIPLTDPPAYAKNVRAARLLPDLFLLDEPAIEVAVSDAEESMPAVAWDNAEYLVTYVDGDVAKGIGGRYVSPEGLVLTSELVATGAYSRPSVVYDGTSFVVAFEGDGNIYAARVARRVTQTITAGRFAVAASPDMEGNAQTVLLGTGRVAMVYTRVATEPLYGGASRAFLRMVEPSGRVRPAR